MRFAFDVAPLADFADPLTIVRLAEAAEAAGWDGFSTWDSLGLEFGTVAADPFVALAGVASATDRLALLASVIVLPRRRPQLVAQAAATLDRLSAGRLVLGVGAGGDARDYTAFGEDWESAVRVRKMDEAVRVVDAFLRGQTVTSDGPDYPVAGVGIGPLSAQRPRPPIWMGAIRPGGIRRSALWDGWIAISVGGDGASLGMSPDDLAQRIELALTTRREARRQDEPFDVAVFGRTGLGGFSPADYEAAGATWWLESVTPEQGSVAHALAMIEAGPPR